MLGRPTRRASDSGARGRGFDPHSGRRVVSLSKIHLLPKSTGYTQDMTEKLHLFTGQKKNETKPEQSHITHGRAPTRESSGKTLHSIYT